MPRQMKLIPVNEKFPTTAPGSKVMTLSKRGHEYIQEREPEELSSKMLDEDDNSTDASVSKASSSLLLSFDVVVAGLQFG